MPDTFPPYTMTDEGSVILNTDPSGIIIPDGDAENTVTVGVAGINTKSYNITLEGNEHGALYTTDAWTYKDYLSNNEIKDIKILLEILHSLPEDNEIKQMFNTQKAVNKLRGEDEN